MSSIYFFSVFLLVFCSLVAMFSKTTKPTNKETVQMIFDGEEKTVAQSEESLYSWQ